MARVRLFAALREIAGDGWVEVHPAGPVTVGAVVTALNERYGERFASITRRSSLVVGDERVAADRSLGPDEELAILPPVSGGAA